MKDADGNWVKVDFAGLTYEDRYWRMLFLLDSSQRESVLSEPRVDPDLVPVKSDRLRRLAA